MRDDLSTAIGYFNLATTYDSACSIAQFNLALALRNKGHNNEAKAAYLLALSHDQMLAEAHDGLAYIYASEDDIEKANSHWFRAVEIGYPVDIKSIKRAVGIEKLAPKRSGVSLFLIFAVVLIVFAIIWHHFH